MANPTPAPESPADLFKSFSLISIQGFGGVVPIIQREIVEKKRWMTKEEFVDSWAVAQILPGPNVVNLSLMFGQRHFGWRGAFAAMAGVTVLPTFIVLLLGIAYNALASDPAVAGVIRGITAVSAGLFIATGLKLQAALKSNALGKAKCAIFSFLCFVGIAILGWSLLNVLVLLGPIAYFLAYRKLAR